MSMPSRRQTRTRHLGFVPKMVESRFARTSTPHLKLCAPRTSAMSSFELKKIAVRAEKIDPPGALKP